MRRAIAAIMPPLLLSACWTGPDFYAGVPSARPIAEGKYKAVRVYSLFPDDDPDSESGQTGERIRLSYGQEGNVIIKGGSTVDDDSHVRLVALDPVKGLYVVQLDPGQGVVALKSSVYGLVALTDDGYRLSVPPCDGAKRIAPGSRITVKGLFGRRQCAFTDRAVFETAMLAFAKDPTSWTEYRRIPDKR